MNEQVSGQPLAVVGEAAPTEKSCCVEGPLRRPDEKLVPVDRLLTGVGRNWINPCSARRVTIRRALDVEHVTERSRGIKLVRFFINNGTYALAAYLHNAVSLPCSLHHGEAIFHVVGHRLFAVDVLTRGACIHNNTAMLVVRHGHNHCIHIFAIQYLLIIARCWNLLLNSLLRRLVAAVVEIANRDTFDAWYIE